MQPSPISESVLARSCCRIIIADDHQLVAQMLSEYLRQQDCEVIATVQNGAELIERVRTMRPTVVLADISMPGLSGLEALRMLRREKFETPIILLTQHADVELAREAIRAGASGYLLKSATGEELIGAIREVLDGGFSVTPSIAAGLIKRIAPANSRVISSRQKQVLRLLARGLSMKEVAAELDLSRRTVESHKYGMMEALGFHSTAELVRYALTHEFLDEL